MIEKMKRTPKAKHGWKVWIRDSSLVNDIMRLSKYLQCDEFFFVTDVQYNKPVILFYTDSDEHAEWVEKEEV